MTRVHYLILAFVPAIVACSGQVDVEPVVDGGAIAEDASVCLGVSSESECCCLGQQQQGCVWIDHPDGDFPVGCISTRHQDNCALPDAGCAEGQHCVMTHAPAWGSCAIDFGAGNTYGLCLPE